MSGDTTEFMKLFFGVEFPSFIKASLSLFELSLKTSKHLSECQGVIRHSNLFYRDMDFFRFVRLRRKHNETKLDVGMSIHPITIVRSENNYTPED